MGTGPAGGREGGLVSGFGEWGSLQVGVGELESGLAPGRAGEVVMGDRPSLEARAVDWVGLEAVPAPAALGLECVREASPSASSVWLCGVSSEKQAHSAPVPQAQPASVPRDGAGGCLCCVWPPRLESRETLGWTLIMGGRGVRGKGQGELAKGPGPRKSPRL